VPPSGALPVYVEVGRRRCFAAAVDWPGWCRSGIGEDGALTTLIAYRARYRKALGPAARGLPDPRSVADLEVVERVGGGSGTEFGTPGVVPDLDRRPVGGSELRRLLRILEACWSSFDRAARAAAGVELAKGPRGGGRDLAKMKAHMAEGDSGYLGAVGGRFPGDARSDPTGLRAAFVDAVEARARGELPDFGPRGGARWPARYAVRRAAWHALDHAWEIEDRSGPAG